MTSTEAKEQIEKHLTKAIDHIDSARLLIMDVINDEKNYSTEKFHLYESKEKIKKMLNQHFDKLARGENQSDN